MYRCPAGLYAKEERGVIAIKTPRLVLRKFLEKDVPGLLEYFKNPRVACFLDEKVENPDKMLEEIRRRNESPEGTELAVCIRESDNVIGNVFSRKEMEDTYSVGWNFNKNYEGKGYAAEAAKAYLDFLFTKKNVRRIYAYVADYNTRSQKLCERLGMRKEGCFLDFISFMKDENGVDIYENTMIYAILKREWIARIKF